MTLYCRRSSLLAHIAASLTISAGLLAGLARGQEPNLLKVKGPEGQTNLRYAFGGVFLVDKTLRDEYDRLLFRIRTLKSGLEDDQIGSAGSFTELRLELKNLQARLEWLQKEIEKKKTFISLGKVHKQTETVTFDLGPERLLVVTAKNVRVEGWDGPQVKCVLEKQVIVPDKDEGAKADEQLHSIRLVHKHGAAPETVGKTSAQREAEEKEYLAGPEASRLTEQERSLHRLVRTRKGDRYRAFQGKNVDTVAIEGLGWDEGNSMIDMEISGSNYTCWAQEQRRHASLTVFVPRCEAVALRDCEKGLIVEGVHGNLLVDGDRVVGPQWNTAFQIHDLHGSLTMFDLWINSLSLSAIHGSVCFPPCLTDENTWQTPSAPYETGNREVGQWMAPRSKSLITCQDVGGDFTASFVWADLHVERVAGKIDVKNDFGDTTLIAETALAKTRHRVVSDSGRIEARLTANGLGSLPIRALSICGGVRADAPLAVVTSQEATWPAADGTAYTWRGMISPVSDRIGDKDAVARCKAVRAVVQGEDASPGLALLSRAGTIRINYKR